MSGELESTLKHIVFVEMVRFKRSHHDGLIDVDSYTYTISDGRLLDIVADDSRANQQEWPIDIVTIKQIGVQRYHSLCSLGAVCYINVSVDSDVESDFNSLIYEVIGSHRLDHTCN